MKTTKKKNINKKQTGGRAIKFCSFAAYFFIFLLAFSMIDFAKAVIANNKSYELVCESDDTISNEQKTYRLYIDGEYYADVDYNLYSSLDDNGNTDYRYCYLIESARELTFSIILMAMVIIIINITYTCKGKPFTLKNVKKIRALGFLQFALAIIPDLVALVMKMLKFSYANATLTFNGLYMFILGGIIMILAQVFDYGVKLQQDNDLIA